MNKMKIYFSDTLNYPTMLQPLTACKKSGPYSPLLTFPIRR